MRMEELCHIDMLEGLGIYVYIILVIVFSNKNQALRK